MYQSSEAFGNWIQQDSRTFQARITLEGKTITEGILSIRINGGSSSEDDFSLGSAVSRYVELEIEKTGMRFEGYEFSLELGLNGEYIPMGYFTAEKPKGDEERLSITAYDRMVKTERACFLELPDSTNTVAVLKGVGTIAGIEVVTEGLTAIPIKKPVGYTCREVLSYVAQLYGGFAICNRAGKIEIKSYEDNDYTVTAGRYWDSFTHNDLPFVLDKITCYTGKNKKGEDISIHVGDGVRGIYFSNPFMDQTALDNVWGKLRNYTYMPGSFRFLGDPRIDPWDVLTVEDRNGNSYKVPAMKLTQEYDGGLSTEVEAVGKTEAEQSAGFTGPNTQNMDRLYAQLVLIDHAMINKLDVDTAKITYATIDNLNALKAEIEQLDVTELTARVALKVEQTDIEEAVNNIQVGGRNMLINSTFNRQGYKWSAGYVEGKSYPKEGRDGGYCAKITGKFNTNCYLLHEDAYRVKAGETYTLSSWTKSKDIVKGTTNYFVSLYIGFYDKDNKYKAEAKINNGQMPLSTAWERNILTFTVPDVSGIDHMWIYLYARDFTGTIWWDDLQLEKANKVSDWSPAVEDIEEDIAEVDGKFINYSTTVQMNAAITAAKDSITSTVSRTYATKTEVSSVSGKVTSLESWKQEASQKITKDGILSTVGDYYATSKYVETVENGVKENEKYIASVETLANQTSNKFLWLVKSGTSATNFELTDRTATLVANAINLKGLVTFSGLNSDTQSKINTAQSTANTAKNNAATAQSAANAAQSTANTAKSTADTITSIVNNNKANWDKGYGWTNSNGGNMINLLTMVKAWTGGAVSATTTINGGFIRTNTITAAQIALGDFTNLVDVNESLPQSAIPAGTHLFSVGSETLFTGGYIAKKNASVQYLALSSYKPNSFCDGDELYYEFTAHGAAVGYCYIAVWFYDITNGVATFRGMHQGTNVQITTSDKTFSGTIKLGSIRQHGFYAVGINDVSDTKIQIYAKNISLHKRNKGNLIVDGAITASKIASGSITTDKLAAQAVTAAKINVKDLFAQDITATGTIRGVTLQGSKGEIGGFQINSTRLYSVDSSGTYAAYFGSYDFNKTNAFVAQTKVNENWVNVLEMRYDGSIISRDKKNTNYRTTIQEGTVTCTGNDGWSASTTVELRNGEIWFYRNKDSIEASIGFDEHGQNSNSATARVTRINASNSGLLLSCQNTPGLYIYKNSLRAWVNLDMNHKSIINSSDERLKTNIVPFAKSVLSELSRLGIVSYAWKETGEQVKAGFTAQNMQSVFPELVEANDAGILGIKTLELMPYVIKGVQELSSKAEDLQEQIKKVRCQQEGDTISLRAQVSSLQYQLQQAFNQLAIQAEQIKKLQAEG